jgi:hypothetical protein
MTDEADFLPSAYLDDEVTAHERALVETDADLLAEVESLRMLRAELSELDPPAISTREEQLAGALAAWDRLPEAERLGTARDATPDGTPATAIAAASAMSRPRDRRRTRAPRWLALAAALVIVVAGAGIVLQRVGRPNGSDDSAATPDVATEETDTEAASEVEGNEVPAADESVGDGDGAPEAETLAAEDLDQELEQLEAAADEGVDLENASPSAEADELGPPADTDTTELPVLADAEDLAEFASFAAGAPKSDTEATTPFAQCDHLGIDVVVGSAAYVGSGPVIVGIDEDRGVAVAYLPDSCTAVETVSLP